MLESSLVAILVNAFMNDNRMQGEAHWIGSALQQGEVKILQHSDYTMWWFRVSLHIRWLHAPQQITVPFAVLVVSARQPTRHARSNLDNSPQHRNISCNVKQFNVQIERLMFYKVIRRNATCTLYHSILRRAISRNSTPFVCTLYHSTLRWAIPGSATPFVCTLYH